MDPTPNIHYIGVVESDAERVVYKKYPIELPFVLLDELGSMQNDPRKTVLDMQAEVERCYPASVRGNFLRNHLAPRNYSDAYVCCAYFPKIVIAQEFESSKGITMREAAAQYDAIVAEWRINGWPLPSQTRNAFVAEKVAKWICDAKRAFRAEMVRYVCSHSYFAAATKAGLAKRLGDDVKMYSTDTIGWTSYCYKISDDVTIRLNSNFGFGRSSYFHLGLIYRGVEIYPYSAYVSYYLANWRTLVAHTREYEPQRGAWDDALEFVVEQANVAAMNPVRFVDEFILGVVNEMMCGLRGIVGLTTAQFHETMNPRNEKRARYLGVSVPDKSSVVCYNAYPHEMLIAYKAEKIGGALAFLGKLKQLGEIHVTVNEAVREIVNLVKGLMPELVQNMERIATDIEILKEKLSEVCAMMAPLQHQLSWMEGEISRFQEISLAHTFQMQMTVWVQEDVINAVRLNARNLYLQQHPEYGQLVTRLSQWQARYNSIETDIMYRKRFRSRLANCKNVAQGVEAYEKVVDALRPHEKEIDRLLSVELGDKNIGDVEPKELSKKRILVENKYRCEHVDYADLVDKRDAVERIVDAFDVMKVR